MSNPIRSLLVLALLSAHSATAAGLAVISVDAAKKLGDSGSSFATLTPSGRYLIYETRADNLAGESDNHRSDIVRYDAKKHTTELLTKKYDGSAIESDCYLSGISKNGRYVGIYTHAPNVVAGVATSEAQGYVRDRVMGKVTLATVNQAGQPQNGYLYHFKISGSGRFAVFATDATNMDNMPWTDTYQVFLRDLKLGTTERVSLRFDGNVPNDTCYAPEISDDGRYVFFSSKASDLIPVDSNGAFDVFVRDRKLGMTLLAAKGESGVIDQGTSDYSVSHDGRFVVFLSDGKVVAAKSTYQGAYVYDRKTDLVEAVHVNSQGAILGGVDLNGMSITDDGRYVALSTYQKLEPTDPANVHADVCLIDRKTGQATRIAKDFTGGDPNDESVRPSLDKHARFIAFESSASDLLASPTTGKQVYRMKR